MYGFILQGETEEVELMRPIMNITSAVCNSSHGCDDDDDSFASTLTFCWDIAVGAVLLTLC